MWRNNYSAFQKKKFSGKIFLGRFEIFFSGGLPTFHRPGIFFPRA